MDLANQSHIIKKIEGWKIRRITNQMEELVRLSSFFKENFWVDFIFFQGELEKQVFDKLKLFLDELEGQEKNSDIDRINELVKVSIISSYFSQNLSITWKLVCLSVNLRGMRDIDVLEILN